jgi:hypothetical protein
MAFSKSASPILGQPKEPATACQLTSPIEESALPRILPMDTLPTVQVSSPFALHAERQTEYCVQDDVRHLIRARVEVRKPWLVTLENDEPRGLGKRFGVAHAPDIVTSRGELAV